MTHQRCPICTKRRALCVRTTATAKGLRRIWHCRACEAQFVSYDEPGDKAAVDRKMGGRLCEAAIRELERLKAVLG